ncbi:MAG: hypothetical protein FWG45_07035 [Oscillospiraceae bacterium]|nr:hypothetical protein [Oscillospiraceae bacterium]
MNHDNQDNLRDSLSQEEITILRKSMPGVAHEAVATAYMGRIPSFGKNRSSKKQKRRLP